MAEVESVRVTVQTVEDPPIAGFLAECMFHEHVWYDYLFTHRTDDLVVDTYGCVETGDDGELCTIRRARVRNSV